MSETLDSGQSFVEKDTSVEYDRCQSGGCWIIERFADTGRPGEEHSDEEEDMHILFWVCSCQQQLSHNRLLKFTAD